VPVTPAIVNVAVLIVDESIVSLNVAVMAVFTATSVAPLAGLVDDTVGAVVSVVPPPVLPPPPPQPNKVMIVSVSVSVRKRLLRVVKTD